MNYYPYVYMSNSFAFAKILFSKSQHNLNTTGSLVWHQDQDPRSKAVDYGGIEAPKVTLVSVFKSVLEWMNEWMNMYFSIKALVL